MKRKRLYGLGAAVLTLVLALTGCSLAGKESPIRFGTGGIGGSYYAYGNALALLAEEADEDLTFHVKATAGSAANLRLLKDGFLQMAIVQSDILSDAWNGSGSFEGKETRGYSAVAGVYTEACQIVVDADSDIQSTADLAGHSVSVGEEESGVLQNAKQILQMSGLTLDMLDAKYLSFADAAAALKEGEIDAFFCTGGTPVTSVAELAKEKPIRLLSLDEDTISRMRQIYEGYTECTIPGGTYKGVDEDVQTLGVKAVVLASDKMREKDVEKITEALFTHESELHYAISVDTDVSVDFAVSDIPVPFHKGASRYYSSIGVTAEEGSGSESGRVRSSQDSE